MLDIMQDPEFIAALQKSADEDHARQPHCSWCGHAGVPYEYNGVRFDGLVACSGDRLCSRCTDSYLESMPLLVEEVAPGGASRLYDINPATWDWSEENIPGCYGQPPVRAIAVAYRPEYADYVRPKPPEQEGLGTWQTSSASTPGTS